MFDALSECNRDVDRPPIELNNVLSRMQTKLENLLLYIK